MILSPEVYNKITAVVFTRREPTLTTVFWARPSNPEGNGFSFFVYDNGSWQPLSQYENVVIPEVDAHLSAFINDVRFYSIPLGGIPLKDLSNAVQNALNSAYQIPSTGIPKTDLSSSVQSSLNKAETALQEETDPTVPAWAKNPNKPSYTAQEVGALPADTPLFSGDYNDLSNKPDIPVIPTNVSAFANDAGYLTQHQDISGKANKSEMSVVNGPDADKTTITLKNGTSATVIKQHQDISGKQDTLVSGTTIKTINNESVLGSGNISVAAELPSNLAYISNDDGQGIIPSDGIRAETVTSAAAMTVNPDVVTVIDGAVGTAAITLQVPQDNLAHVWDILLTTDSTVAITFAMSNSATILTPSGFSIGASKAVEISVIGVGTKYCLRYGEFA